MELYIKENSLIHYYNTYKLYCLSPIPVSVNDVWLPGTVSLNALLILAAIRHASNELGLLTRRFLRPLEVAPPSC